MKAEHRKELQTNALADRMGRLLQRMKAPKKKSVLIWVLVLAVIVVAGIWYYSYRARTINRIEQWFQLSLAGDPPELNRIAETYKTTEQANLARFQLAWYYTWELGVKFLGNPQTAQDYSKFLADGVEKYAQLAKDMKDDPVLYAEAIYNQAAGTEALAIRAGNPFSVKKGDNLVAKILDEAQRLYQELADAQPDSVLGKAAAKRAQELEKNSKSRREIEEFYQGFFWKSLGAGGALDVPHG
jgi:hypothetical protein